MRIAVSGAHQTGKTTLIEELSRALPSYGVVDEPYHLLEEEGHAAGLPDRAWGFRRLRRQGLAAAPGERDAAARSDRWSLGLEAIEMAGSLRERARQVVAYVKRRSVKIPPPSVL